MNILYDDERNTTCYTMWNGHSGSVAIFTPHGEMLFVAKRMPDPPQTSWERLDGLSVGG